MLKIQEQEAQLSELLPRDSRSYSFTASKWNLILVPLSFCFDAWPFWGGVFERSGSVYGVERCKIVFL